MDRLPDDPARPPWASEYPTRAEYRARLADLDAAFVDVAAGVAHTVGQVHDALMAGDQTLVDGAGARDAHIAERCEALEDGCFVLIAREAPVAADLREIVAIVRGITDLQRSSKLLVHIAAALERVHPPAMDANLRAALGMLGDGAQRIFEAGVEAWRSRDGLAINELEELDDEVDRLEEGLLLELYHGPLDRNRSHSVEEAVVLALLGRHYERVADHGVELARHVSWAVTGDRVASRP